MRRRLFVKNVIFVTSAVARTNVTFVYLNSAQDKRSMICLFQPIDHSIEARGRDDLLSERPSQQDDDHEGDVGADAEASKSQKDRCAKFLKTEIFRSITDDNLGSFPELGISKRNFIKKENIRF